MIKFTSASAKDNDLVTVTISQFFTNEGGSGFLPKGTRLVLNVKGVDTLFTVNRANRTACTRSFPRRLKLPKTGKPVSYEVKYVEVLSEF